MSATAGSSYEEIPWQGFALYLTHPNHLTALARLFAMTPPEIATCRVLELGCAQGDNLIPMAASLPGARFVGIDLSPRHIAEGRAAIAELGLENIELRVQDILDVSPGLGSFDFIVAHGAIPGCQSRSESRCSAFATWPWRLTAWHSSATIPIPAGPCAR
jgi:SAM-dependent methyltransferase